MTTKETIYALNSQGLYNRTSRNSAHPSIVLANSRMVKLSYTKCNEIYKGDSYFIDPEAEEFYYRSRSTPSKMAMSKTVSTNIADSNHHSREKSVEIKRTYLRNREKYYHPLNDLSRHSIGQQTQTRYQYEDAAKFQLPKQFQNQHGTPQPKIKKEEPTPGKSNQIQNLLGQSPNNISPNITGRVQKGHNPNIDSATKLNYLSQDHQKRLNPEYAQKQTSKDIFNTPRTSYETPSKNYNSINFLKSSQQTPSSHQFKKNGVYQTPNRESSLNLRNHASTVHKSVGRKVLFDEASIQKNLIKLEPSNTNANKIKYEEFQNNRNCEKQVKNYISQPTKIMQGKQIENCDTRIFNQKEAVQKQVMRLRQQLQEKTMKLAECEKTLHESENRQKIMKYELDKLKTSHIRTNSVCLGQRKRDWGSELRKEFGAQNSKAGLFVFTLFLVFLSKETLN